MRVPHSGQGSIMFRTEDNEDLRVEIFHLKKQLSDIGAENHLLKVKIRKLQSEIVRKDKQMDVVLDPRKSTDVRKILYERSASFVLNMKDKNDELLQLLHEKDVLIRRLQNQVDMTKLYSLSPKRHFFCKCFDKPRQMHPKVPLLKPDERSRNNRSLSWTPGLQEAESTLMEDILEEESSEKKASSSYDIKDQYKSLSKEHLLSIIENLKNNQRYSPTSRQTSSRKSSPESDLERIELLCESPHEEIQQLHLHFLDMISEVDHLKNTINQLQNSQEKTENVLKKKDTNIDRLAQQIKNLKRPKSRAKTSRSRNNRCYNNTDIVARVYGDNNSTKNCSRNEKEKKNHGRPFNNKIGKSENENVGKSRRSKQSTKDVMVQVEELVSPGINHCVYVEKGSITITQKRKEEKECGYEDEIFEECDEESVVAE